MRKSLQSIPLMVDESKDYPGLPAELLPYYAYLKDCGHSILAIAKPLLDDSTYGDITELWELEAAVPVKYVLSHPYEFYHGYIVVDIPYDPVFGIDVGEDWEEF